MSLIVYKYSLGLLCCLWRKVIPCEKGDAMAKRKLPIGIRTFAVIFNGEHRAAGKPIHLIGVKFSRDQRQVVAFEWEQVPA